MYVLPTFTLFSTNVRKIIISGQQEFKILLKSEIFLLQPAKKHEFEFDFGLRNEISRKSEKQNGIALTRKKNERISWNS